MKEPLERTGAHSAWWRASAVGEVLMRKTKKEKAASAPFQAKIRVAFGLSLVGWMVLTLIRLGGQTRPLLTERIDERRLISLKGNTRPEVGTAEDHGIVAEDLRLEHLFLQLRRSPER